MNERLYLHGEQGAGDVVMMLRYLPRVRPLVKTLTVEVMTPLVALARDLCASRPELADVAIAERGVPPDPDAHDCQMPMLSLPALFSTTPDTVPDPVDWRPTDADSSPIRAVSRRIGLCWAGSPGHQNDRARSMPFETMAQLLELAPHGFTFQSLQYGVDVPASIDPCPTGDFLATARAIATCETVVSVDTSVAHLAGSMGTRVLICLPFIAEWRWMLDRKDSPWYPSATLVRQTKADDWAGVIAECRSLLFPQPESA